MKFMDWLTFRILVVLYALEWRVAAYRAKYRLIQVIPPELPPDDAGERYDWHVR